MATPPHDDLPSAEFFTLLEEMLARVAAAAREADRTRLAPTADAAPGVSPVDAGAQACEGSAPTARVHLDAHMQTQQPDRVDASRQDASESCADVWADTTPFWPGESPEWPAPAQQAPPPGDGPAGRAAAADKVWIFADASIDLSSIGSPLHIVDPAGRPTDPAPRRRWTRQASPVAVALVIAVAVGFGFRHTTPPAAPATLATSLDSLPPPSAGRAPAAVDAVRSADTGRLAVDIAIDADASTESRMLDELRHADGATRSVAGANVASTLAIARYDTLPAASADWQVVATLGTEEVYALVPAGSPLRHLDDLRGRRINVGPDGSARAVSGAALYRALFGAAPSRSNSSALARDDALRQMLATGEPDALLLFDGQPSSWLAALPASTRQALRLLRLDPGAPASRRALQSYLPGRLAPGVGQDSAPVPTLREVTFLIAPSSERNLAPTLHALCDRLPALRANGHPKWREVDPALSLPIGLRRSAQLDAILDTCAPPLPVPSINRRSS